MPPANRKRGPANALRLPASCMTSLTVLPGGRNAAAMTCARPKGQTAAMLYW